MQDEIRREFMRQFAVCLLLVAAFRAASAQDRTPDTVRIQMSNFDSANAPSTSGW
jgi:hypothetical protein